MHQVADALSCLLTGGTNNTPVEDDLPALVAASGDAVEDLTTSIFALEARTNIPTCSVTDADGTDFIQPTLAQFINSQSADKFWQTLPDNAVSLIPNSR